MVFINTFNSSPCPFFSRTRPFVWKAFSSVNVALVSPSTSSRWKQELEGILFTPTLSPYSSLHTDAAGLCKVSFHTPRSKERREWRYLAWKRALSLFVAVVRRLLSLCCVVLWPRVWSETRRLYSLRMWMSQVMQCKPCPICHILDGKSK